MRRARGIAVSLLLCAAASARITGVLAPYSGAPGEPNCSACHGSGVNTGPGRLQIQVQDLTHWLPERPLRVRITLSDPDAARWGFQLTARAESNARLQAGSFRILDTDTQLATTGGLQFVTHTLNGTRPGTRNSSIWEVEWLPPPNADFGKVVFYAAGNAADGNGIPDPGDRIYTTSFTLAPAASVSRVIKALPQLAYGSSPEFGVWSTAVYLHNTTPAPVQAVLRFFDQEGAPLNVPALQTDNIAVSIPPRATHLTEIPAQGPLTQGWVQVEMPEGVVGYGLFRQSLPNVNPQEGIVPFSSVNSAGATIVYDDRDYVTALAVLNPGSSPATINFLARDSNGEEIARHSVQLRPRQRTAFVLRELAPPFERIRGRTGVLEITAESGSVSVLGLRFNRLAFTSILPVER